MWKFLNIIPKYSSYRFFLKIFSKILKIFLENFSLRYFLKFFLEDKFRFGLVCLWSGLILNLYFSCGSLRSLCGVWFNRYPGSGEGLKRGCIPKTSLLGALYIYIIKIIFFSNLDGDIYCESLHVGANLAHMTTHAWVFRKLYGKLGMVVVAGAPKLAKTKVGYWIALLVIIFYI